MRASHLLLIKHNTQIIMDIKFLHKHWVYHNATASLYKMKQQMQTYFNQHHHTTTILRPFLRDHPGEPVPEENFWTLWRKGRLTQADNWPSGWAPLHPD